MEYSSFVSIVQTILVLIIVIILANISLKLLNKQMNKHNRIIKVVERISVNSNSALGIVNICGTYYLMSLTDKENRILKELNNEDIESVIKEMELNQSFTDIKEKANLYFGMRKKS